MIEEGKEWELHQISRTHRKLVNRATRLESGLQKHTKGTKNQQSGSQIDREDLEDVAITIFAP
jgi:tRNA dimethylallyltransferase